MYIRYISVKWKSDKKEEAEFFKEFFSKLCIEHRKDKKFQ